MKTMLKRHQLAIIAAAADRLPAEKRVTFLDRIKGQLSCAASVSPTPILPTQCVWRSRG